MTSTRRIDVLRAVVSDFVREGEPVGSKTLVERHDLGVSPATIRNDMAVLEEEGYLYQPHTSAGRVPTPKGYRQFVDHIAALKPLSVHERRAIETFLEGAYDIDDVIERTVRILSQLTRQLAVVQYPLLRTRSLRHIELVRLGDHQILAIAITDSGDVLRHIIEFQRVISDDDVDAISVILNSRDESKQSDTRCSKNTSSNSAMAHAGMAHAGTNHSNKACSGTDSSGTDSSATNTSGTDSSGTGSSSATYASAAHSSAAHAGAASADDNQQIATRISETIERLLVEEQEQRVIVAGASNLVRSHLEFQGSLVPVLDALEEHMTLLRLFTHRSYDEEEVCVSIGAENQHNALVETAVVSDTYTSGSSAQAHLGVVGPLRMDYPATMSAVRAVASYLSDYLGNDRNS